MPLAKKRRSYGSFVPVGVGTFAVFSVSLVALALEFQAGFTGGIGQGGHAAVILIRAAVKRDFCDPRRLGTLGNRLADGSRRGTAAGETESR